MADKDTDLTWIRCSQPIGAQAGSTIMVGGGYSCQQASGIVQSMRMLPTGFVRVQVGKPGDDASGVVLIGPHAIVEAVVKS